MVSPCLDLRAGCNHVSSVQDNNVSSVVAWVAPHGSSTLWPWPPRASSRPLSAPTIRGWCFAAHSQIFSASRRHSRPAMTRNPNQPYSPSTPLLGCLGGCSTFTHTWPGHVLVCALFVIKYLAFVIMYLALCCALFVIMYLCLYTSTSTVLVPVLHGIVRSGGPWVDPRLRHGFHMTSST